MMTSDFDQKGKIDENFVKYKFDSMCGQPQKIKFQFYNINIANYDYKPNKKELPIEEQYHYLDFHHFEKDETLGSFLVRVAQ